MRKIEQKKEKKKELNNFLIHKNIRKRREKRVTGKSCNGERKKRKIKR